MPTDSVTAHAPEPYNSQLGDRHTLALILTVILLVFFLLGFFSVHLCRYLASVGWLRRLNSPAGENRQRPGLNSRVGLDPSLIDSFPTFIYSSVKEHQSGNYELECAVCLSEFDEDDVLRLLPVCSHVFHRDCIDLWLESHTTCPVCRHDLNPPEEKSQSPEVIIQVTEADGRRSDENSGGGGEDERTSTPTTTPPKQQRTSFNEEEAVRGEGEEREGEGGADVEDRKRHVADLDRLTRSHSTGHSPGGTHRHERYTLRLPEHVKQRIWRQRNWTGSCIPFSNFSEDPNKDDLDNGRSGLSRRGAESA